MNFGEEILKYRAENNLTQKEMAEMLGVTPFMIYRYENNISNPSKANAIRFKNKMYKRNESE